jgi:hypothetical protein
MQISMNTDTEKQNMQVTKTGRISLTVGDVQKPGEEQYDVKVESGN